MSKAKRGKSGSASEVVNWEKELVFAPYTEDDWKAMVSFLMPQHSTDKDVVNLLTDIISTGLRKMFSVISYEHLLTEAKEIAIQGKGTKMKSIPTGKAPQFAEICDHVKGIMDRGETISSTILARLIKFKLLMIKTKDQERRVEETKLLKTSSKQHLDVGTPSKGGSSPRKSQSPAKGSKKGAKKEEKAPSPKKDTKLKKRGEETDDFKTLDDEPDGENDPKHYIILTGFTDASLISFLLDMKIPVNSIISIKTDYHLRLLEEQSNHIEEEVAVEAMELRQKEDNEVEENLECFWKDSSILLKYAPPGHLLHDIAKFDVIVKEDCLPENMLDAMDAEKKLEFSSWLFDKVADVCYDTLDYEQQYKRYIENLKIVDVSIVADRNPSSLSNQGVAESQSGSTVPAETTGVLDLIRPIDDLRYYDKLMSFIPIEVESIPLQLDCLLEQVTALTDGPNPMDIPKPVREDGLNDTVGNYLDQRLMSLGLTDVKCVPTKTSKKTISPQIIYSRDKQKYGTLNINENEFYNAHEVQQKMQQYHPYTNFIGYLQPVADEWIRNCARRQQLYNICTENYSMSVEKFERAMRQYIFESLPLETATDNSQFSDDQEALAEQQLEKISSRWDDPYCDMVKIQSSQSIEKEILKETSETSLRNLDAYNWLEHFEPSVLFQILDDGSDIRPYLDTYYNRGNNTLLAVMHNPSNDNLQNTYNWGTWLHSNVGFRDYLENVAIEIEEWTKEQDQLAEEKLKEETPREVSAPPLIPPPIKERSRWGLQTRAEIQAANNVNKPDTGKRKKSAKCRSRSGSPKKNTSKSPEKKDKGRKTPSAKKGSRAGTATKRPISSKSNVSFKDEIIHSLIPLKDYVFTGYNLGNVLAHVNGEQSFMFPQNGDLIKVEKFSYVEGSMSVQMTVYSKGDIFILNFSNPVDKEDEEEEDKENVNENIEKKDHGGRKSILSENSNKTNNELPSLPCKSQSICSYSNMTATFKDGMIVTLSSSDIQTTELSHIAILKTISSISKEPSEIVTQQISSSVAPPKSPKGKRGGKKEDDSKQQEEILKQQQKNEFAKSVLERQNEIIRMLKEKESKKNLYMTTPDGSHVTFQHDILIDQFYGDIYESNEILSVKQENLKCNYVEEKLEDLMKVNEVYRTITQDGYLIKYMSNETVEILSSNGEIYRSSTYTKNESSFLSDGEQPLRPNSKKSTKSSKIDDVSASPLPDELTDQSNIDWHIIQSNGRQMILKSSGDLEYMDNLMVSNATCFTTGQVQQTREDGVIIVNSPCGTKVVEYLDGTRMTRYEIEQPPVNNNETGEVENSSTNDSKATIILIEHSSNSSVYVDITNHTIKCCYGNGKQIKAFKDGRYIISNGDQQQLIIDGENGSALLHPCQRISDTLSLDDIFELTSNNGSCILRQSVTDCLKYVDHHGNTFTVNHFGEYNVVKNLKAPISNNLIRPRYFVIYPDGSGEELLRYEDIEGYVTDAHHDQQSAVIQSNVEGDNQDAKSTTVIKPYKEKPSTVWKCKKVESNIIPVSLRERDFKTFPTVAENNEKLLMSSFGTRMCPQKPLTRTSQCSDFLEIRHFIQYDELTSDVRHHIIDGINKYGDFVQQQQDNEDSYINKDERTEEEKFISEQIKKKYYEDMKTVEKNEDGVATESPEVVLKEQYLNAIKPPSPPPVSRAQPKRPIHEWEKDKIELAELKHAKNVLRSRKFPSYFDTEQGQKFLYENGILPNMDELSNDLAFETRRPKHETPSMTSSTPTESILTISPNNQILDQSPVSTTIITPILIDDSSPHMEESSYSIRSSSLSMKFDNSANTISPYVSSMDGSICSARPLNPTPKQAGDHTISIDGIDTLDESIKLATIPEVSNQTSNVTAINGKTAMSTDTSFNPSEVGRHIKTPMSILGSRPNALPNEKFSTIEESVRRQVKTASISGTVNSTSTSKLRGFVLLPDLIDFGILREGLSYSFPVTMKNVGMDSCRFKIKQPPPSTGLKVVFKPGPVAAGISIVFQVDIFAVAVGVEGVSGIGQVSHHIEIVTETDILYLPVIATIMTQYEYENPTAVTPRGGPSKGTLVLNTRPNSRDNITRPKKE